MEWKESDPLRLTLSLETIHLKSWAYRDMASESRESAACMLGWVSALASPCGVENMVENETARRSEKEERKTEMEGERDLADFKRCGDDFTTQLTLDADECLAKAAGINSKKVGNNLKHVLVANL